MFFPGNFSHDKKRFAKSHWLCKCEESREDESHIMAGHCKVYGDLTEKYPDFTDNNSLVQFFTEVLYRRDRLDKEQLDKEQLDKEQLDKERLDKERLDKERLHPVGGVNTDVGANPVLADGIRQSGSS